MWTPPSIATLAVFLVIVFGLCAALMAAVRAYEPRLTTPVALGLVAWLAFTAMVPLSGVLDLGTIPLVGFMFVCNFSAVGLAFSRVGTAVGRAPLWILVGIQSFRVPLEAVLHRWGEVGTIPMSMTWEGQNLDVFAGLLAVIAAPVVAMVPSAARPAAWGFNVVGLGLLINVGRVAILSSPGPQRIFGDPPLLLAFHVPTVWIVPICVAGALFTHLVLFRRLLGR